MHLTVDTLGIEPRASRMLSGCDTTTPHALDHTSSMSVLRANQALHAMACQQIQHMLGGNMHLENQEGGAGHAHPERTAVRWAQTCARRCVQRQPPRIMSAAHTFFGKAMDISGHTNKRGLLDTR